MTIAAKNFILPPVVKNAKGYIRKVGFEIEFSGIGLDQAADAVAGLFGGKIVAESRFLYKVAGTVYGEFSVELDAAVLKDQRYKEYFSRLGFDMDRCTFGNDIEHFLFKIAKTLVPHEIVLPPIPVTELDIVERLRENLRLMSAKGTKSSIVYAFSLQINPEVPSLKAGIILNYLRAFVLLYNWIFKISKIDLSRRIAPFINDFPEHYIQKILNFSYAPSIDQLIGDYLMDNPTRNRPLDMLPLFCFIDCDLVFKFPVEKELIKARPAFHYRLPNSLIDDPEWSIAREWNLWVEVEKLADNPAKIKAMADDFRTIADFPPGFKMLKWAEKVPYWLEENKNQ